MRVRKAIMRRTAMVGVLVVALIQSQLGGAVTASSYDEAYSSRTVIHDRTGGGSAEARASASKATGLLKASAAVTSDAPFGTPTFDLGIGGNHAQATALVKQYFQVTSTTSTVTATVRVDKLERPAPVWDEDAELNAVRFGQQSPRLGSSADSYAVLVLHAFYAPKKDSQTDNANYFVTTTAANVQPAREERKDQIDEGIGKSDVFSTPGSEPRELAEKQITLSVFVKDQGEASDEPKVLVVTVLLQVAARAWGESAWASAACEAQVMGIGVS